MITVHKYIINPETEIPKHAEILSVAFQGEDLCLWARIDTDNELVVRKFHSFGTGHEIQLGMGIDFSFVGTAFYGVGLVFHVFERHGL